MTTIAVAALTSIGAEFGKTWLPSAASYIWSKATNSELIFVTVLRDERQSPISKASVIAAHPNPEQKTIFDKAVTDEDGRAVLENVKTRDFFLRITYTEGGKIFTRREMVTIDKYPYVIKIADGNGWVSSEIETSGTSIVSNMPRSSTSEPPVNLPNWFQIALQEVGVKEAPAPDSNPRIEEYHASTSFGRHSQDQPWGCSFVSWVLEQAEVQGNIKSARCEDYLKFGKEISEPRQGAVTVLTPEGTKEAWSGVTGFLIRSDSQTVTLIVGNVDDQVTIATFPRDRVRGFRWPS